MLGALIGAQHAWPGKMLLTNLQQSPVVRPNTSILVLLNRTTDQWVLLTANVALVTCKDQMSALSSFWNKNCIHTYDTDCGIF